MNFGVLADRLHGELKAANVASLASLSFNQPSHRFIPTADSLEHQGRSPNQSAGQRVTAAPPSRLNIWCPAQIIVDVSNSPLEYIAWTIAGSLGQRKRD